MKNIEPRPEDQLSPAMTPGQTVPEPRRALPIVPMAEESAVRFPEGEGLASVWEVHPPNPLAACLSLACLRRGPSSWNTYAVSPCGSRKLTEAVLAPDPSLVRIRRLLDYGPRSLLPGRYFEVPEGISLGDVEKELMRVLRGRRRSLRTAVVEVNGFASPPGWFDQMVAWFTERGTPVAVRTPLESVPKAVLVAMAPNASGGMPSLGRAVLYPDLRDRIDTTPEEQKTGPELVAFNVLDVLPFIGCCIGAGVLVLAANGSALAVAVPSGGTSALTIPALTAAAGAAGCGAGGMAGGALRDIVQKSIEYINANYQAVLDWVRNFIYPISASKSPFENCVDRCVGQRGRQGHTPDRSSCETICEILYGRP